MWRRHLSRQPSQAVISITNSSSITPSSPSPSATPSPSRDPDPDPSWHPRLYIISCNWSCVIFWFCVNAEVLHMDRDDSKHQQRQQHPQQHHQRVLSCLCTDKKELVTNFLFAEHKYWTVLLLYKECDRVHLIYLTN